VVAYYNEKDRYAAGWLRNLISVGLIPSGDVDERSIEDVQPGDLAGYTHCHFFAGIGGWAYAGLLAGWPDDRPWWTGSCPCQPFSVAGRGAGTDDPRHLWPHFFRLIRSCRPVSVMGEQVAGKAGYGWLDGVRADLESEDYTCRGVDIPSCAVDAPHIRNRLYWCAVEHTESIGRREGRPESAFRGRWPAPAESDAPSGVADAEGARCETRNGISVGDEQARPRAFVNASCGVDNSNALRGLQPQGRVGEQRGWSGDANAFDVGDPGSATSGRYTRTFSSAETGEHCQGQFAWGFPDGPSLADGRNGSFWSDAEWISCHDGKARRTQPGVPLLVDGLPDRVALWRGFGNAINPVLAAEVIRAFLDTN
jgi:DNA (cytosine-5)-methyltransferase 1